MAGSGFYSYLYASVKNRYVRTLSITLLLLTGLSRPYLGVHYLEDVPIGWALGLSIALLSVRYAESIGSLWNRFSYPQQLLIAAASSLVLWGFTRAQVGWSTEAQPLAFVGYAGFLTGIVAGYPVERRTVDFDPRSSTVARRALRYLLTVGLILGTLLILDEGFGAVSGDSSPLGYLLRYIRYTIAGIVATLLGPLLFVKLGLAERIPRGSRERRAARR